MYSRIIQQFKAKGVTFKKNGIPLYLQLAAFIRRNIESGTWPAGMRMPNLETIAEDFAVARLTARQAIQLLVGEELLISQQGKGTFVATTKQQKNYQRLQTSWDEIVSRVETAEVEIIQESDVDFCPAFEDEKQLFVPTYHFMKRVHSFNGVPFGLVDVYLARHIFDQAPELILNRPVITVLNELGIEVAKARQILTIGAADPEAACHLGIATGDPVAHVRRIAQDKKGYTFYMGNIIFRGDQVRQDIDLLTS